MTTTPTQLQLDVWPPRARPPRARRSDPESSHRAADRIEASGKVGEQTMRLLRALAKWPGRTTKQLAQLCDPSGSVAARDLRYAFARRAPELTRRAPPLARAEDHPEGKRWRLTEAGERLVRGRE